MKLKTFLPLIIIVSLCFTCAFAAGSSSDPLISLSFLRGEFLENLYTSAYEEIDSATDSTATDYKNAFDGGDVGQMTRLILRSGDSVEFGSGMGFILTDGSARINIDKGHVINTTVTAEARTGIAVKNARYILDENSYVTLTISSDSVVFADGYVKVNSDTFGITYNDVLPSDWFYADVMAATEMGLINGMTDTTFEPNGTISYAQVIKLAATTHEYYETGKVTLENGSPWYKNYVDYALEHKLITVEPTDYNASAMRDYYIAVMYRAMPDSEYAKKNDIADNAVPDVQSGADFYDEIYAFYRAGIVTGVDKNGIFMPKSEVRRNEVATLVARMFDDSVRKAVTLEK